MSVTGPVTPDGQTDYSMKYPGKTRRLAVEWDVLGGDDDERRSRQWNETRKGVGRERMDQTRTTAQSPLVGVTHLVVQGNIPTIHGDIPLSSSIIINLFFFTKYHSSRLS